MQINLFLHCKIGFVFVFKSVSSYNRISGGFNVKEQEHHDLNSPQLIFIRILLKKIYKKKDRDCPPKNLVECPTCPALCRKGTVWLEGGCVSLSCARSR